MSDQPETPKILDEIAKKNQPSASAKSKARKGVISNLTLTVGLVLPLLIAVAYLAYQQRELNNTIVNAVRENGELSTQIISQSEQLENLQRNLSELSSLASQPRTIDTSALQTLETSVGNQFGEIQAQLLEIQSQQTSNEVEVDFEWKVFEADYLLGVANQKLALEGDIVAAIAMIEAADSALLASGNDRVFALRQAISDDLARLRVIEPFDRQGLYFQLGSLVQAIESLELQGSQRTNFGEESALVAAAAEDDLGLVASSFEFLNSVFVWRRWDETPTSMLAPDQGVFIKQNLRLMLEQSQLALLMKDQELFSQTLSKSNEWLLRYAQINSDSAQLITDTLTQLSQLDINPALPNINDSVDLVRQLAAASR